MNRPKVNNMYFQEREGVIQVSLLLNSLHLLFRETPNADVGIDGQIELVDDNGNATGHTVAVQIKSGKSYLKGDKKNWGYYPSEKHRMYWENYPLPVILMIHNPDTNNIYWSDARQQLRSDQYSDRFISIPKENILTINSRSELFQSLGVSGEGLDTVEDALRKMSFTKIDHPYFNLSHLDIFLEGLSDIGRKIFFSVGMCFDLAELRLPNDSELGVGIGNDEQSFLDDYIKYIVAQSLVIADYSDFLIDIIDRRMLPTFYVPLTSRGRALRDLCRSLSNAPPPALTEAPICLNQDYRKIDRAKANEKVANQLIAYFQKNK